MSDAWLGRMACGDHDLDTLAGAHEHSRALYRETRRIGLNDGDLYAQVAAPLYVTVPVWSRATIALAYAAALISAAATTRPRGCSMTRSSPPTPRPPNGTSSSRRACFTRPAAGPMCARSPPSARPRTPPTSWSRSPPRSRRCPPLRPPASDSSRPHWSSADRLSPDNQFVAADIALTRGWCRRELGDEEGARASFRDAAVDGALLEPARQALDNPKLRLIVTDADTIATRTDPWDPGTEVSRSTRDAAALALEQQQVLDQAQARLDELIGLEGPKEQIAVWRTEIQIDQLLAAQGEETSATNENHMVLEGPPGTAKTSFARIVAEILFGLGKIQRPDVMEVTEEDLVVGYVSQTAQRMKEVCEEALGGVLFIDEAYRLVPEHEGHSFGKDAINTLLKYMEDFRDQLVVIVAGYPVEMRRFLAANPGLASRFHFTLTFESYTAGEIVAIGAHIATKEKIAISEPRGRCWRPRRRGCVRCQPIPGQPSTSRATDGMPARWLSPASVNAPGGCTPWPRLSWPSSPRPTRRCWWSTTTTWRGRWRRRWRRSQPWR